MMYIYTILNGKQFEVSNSDMRYKAIFNGDTTVAESTVLRLNTELLNESKTLKIKELHTFVEAIVETKRAKYSPLEKSRHPSQEAEWTLWNQDKSLLTPKNDTIASKRGIDREAFLAKVGENVLEIDAMVGYQQNQEDKINACGTKEAIDEIVFKIETVVI